MNRQPSNDFILTILSEFRKAFTKPGFEYFQAFVLGMLLNRGKMWVTRIIKNSCIPKNFTNFHRFLRTYRWEEKSVSGILLSIVTRFLPLPKDKDGNLLMYLVIDSTYAKKYGKKIFGADFHFDHSRKDSKDKYIWGHCWLIAGLLYSHPVLRWLFFPICNRLYLREKTIEKLKEGGAVKGYKSLLALTKEMIEEINDRVRGVGIKVTTIMDSFFAKSKFLKSVKGLSYVITRLRKDGVVFPPLQKTEGKRKRGRPPKYGEKVKLANVMKDSEKIEKGVVFLYGKMKEVSYVSLIAYLRGYPDLVRIVVVKGIKGTVHLMSTDVSLSPCRIIELYGARFKIELCIRDLKQHVGFGDYQVRKERAIKKFTLLSMVSYTIAKLYYAVDEKFRKSVVLNQRTPWNSNDYDFSIDTIKSCLQMQKRRENILSTLGRWGINTRNSEFQEEILELAA